MTVLEGLKPEKVFYFFEKLRSNFSKDFSLLSKV